MPEDSVFSSFHFALRSLPISPLVSENETSDIHATCVKLAKREVKMAGFFFRKKGQVQQKDKTRPMTNYVNQPSLVNQGFIHLCVL